MKMSKLLCFSLCFFLTQGFACTGVVVKTKNHNIIYARTMEYALDMHSSVLAIPKGYQYSATLPNGFKGLHWKTKYNILAINMMGLPDVVDGINSKGLSFGLFLFPGFAQYQKLTKQNASRALAPWQFGAWLLGNFSTVEQVKAAIQSNQIALVNVAISIGGFSGTLPAHYFVTDASGHSIVIEPVDGELKVYDDPLGVVTNGPTFDWHMTNLRNYINLSATNIPKVKMGKIDLTPIGQGSGMLGLPGDFTPPSRFIRMVALTQSAKKVKTAKEGVILAWNIINNVDIPLGAVYDSTQKPFAAYELTQWAVVWDISNRTLYFRTYNNLEIKKVMMRDIKFQTGKILSYPMSQPPSYRNVSMLLK